MKLPSGRFRKLSVLLVALGLAAATACSNSSGQTADTGTPAPGNNAPGVTDTEIRFAVLGTRSNNPLGTCVQDCFKQGIEAYFAFRNSEGGVHGRKLVITRDVDDQLGQNQQKAIEIISANDTFATFSAPQIASGWADLAEAGIPLYVWPIHPTEMAGQKGIFGAFAPPCQECPDRTYAYVAKLAGAKKVAALGYGISENSKRCVTTITTTIDRYKDATGQEVVYQNDSLAFGLPNGVGPEVSAMKRAGAEIILTCLDLNGMKTLAQELERQGMGDVPMLHPNTYNQKFVAEAGDLFEGDYIGVTFRPFESDPGETGLVDFFKWMEETGAEPTELAMFGWIAADLAYQGILAAGPSFTRESVIEATNKMTAYTADGLVTPIDWSRQHDLPTLDDPVTHGYKQVCRALVQVRGGKFEVVGGTKEKPFLCWPPENATWSEPQPTSFE